MLDFENQQRMAEAAERAASAVVELALWLKSRVRLCAHGYIHVTCAACAASWLKN